MNTTKVGHLGSNCQIKDHKVQALKTFLSAFSPTIGLHLIWSYLPSQKAQCKV
jgi:hypothetical protein